MVLITKTGVTMPAAVIPAIIVVVAGGLGIILFKLMWRVAEPNKAMIISGLREKGPAGTAESVGFRVITGKGCFVIPGVQAVRTLGLNLHEAPLQVSCPTTQGIPVVVRGSVIYKVADDYASIANAARRFLGQEQRMDDQVHTIFAGHLRQIIGTLTVEQLLRDRESLEQATRESTHTEMEKLGFQLDSLKIQEIDDPTGYIENLAKPHIAEVQKTARIAAATNDREASQQEAAAQAQVAEARRDSNIKQAGYQAEVNRATATASQAGPLAEADAKKDVVKSETEVAQLEADRTERQLDATVRKPADAQNYARIKQAEADRQASILAAEAAAQSTKLNAAAQAEQTKTVGEAEGAAIRAKGEAEGAALKARAEGLAANQDAVIGQQLADKVPEIVRAAASAFDNVGNFTVLNGAHGLMDALNSVVAEGVSSLKTVRAAVETNGQNGAAGTDRPTHAVPR